MPPVAVVSPMVWAWLLVCAWVLPPLLEVVSPTLELPPVALLLLVLVGVKVWSPFDAVAKPPAPPVALLVSVGVNVWSPLVAVELLVEVWSPLVALPPVAVPKPLAVTSPLVPPVAELLPPVSVTGPKVLPPLFEDRVVSPMLPPVALPPDQRAGR